METRDILDSDGNTIGSIDMPEGTSEEVWAEKLSHYSYTPPAQTTTDLINWKVADAVRFGAETIALFKRKNIESGITQADKTKVVSDYCHWLNHYLEQGSLYAALEQINLYLIDTDSGRGDAGQFVTDVRLNYYKQRIQTYLGVLPT